MPANKILSIPPIQLTTTTTTNLLNCNVTSLAGPVGFTMTQPYILIKRIHAVNRTASAVTCSLWKGLTAANTAGTEFEFNLTTIPANGFVDVYPAVNPFNAADFLVGGASANSAVTLNITAEIGVSG